MEEYENNQFTPNLMFAFQENSKIILITRLMPGGDLYKHLSLKHCFKESEVKFLFINIVLALQYFHAKNIVYGDLKPENILVDDDGYLRLTDLGFARSKHSASEELFQTIEYMAPEIINGEPLSKSSDFWSLGCILYEMLIGIPPFYHENEGLVLHLILKNQLHYPNNCQLSQECKNMIAGLLTSDPKNRIGSKNGVDEIKMHDWLKG